MHDFRPIPDMIFVLYNPKKSKLNDFTKINAKIHIQTINSDYGFIFSPGQVFQFDIHYPVIQIISTKIPEK